MTVRIALMVEYDGTFFHGFQAQQNLPTVQHHLEVALSKIANEPVYIFCAGRTDRGVHATAQIIHFDTHAKRHIDAWVWGTNIHLPPGIVVKFAKHMDFKFHARFSAISRRYRYIIYNHPIRPALLTKRVLWYYYPLDVHLMNEAGQYLLGEQDFSSFRSSQCNSKTPMRCVIAFNTWRQDDFVFIEIEANAFLHNMVRNVVGVLLKIGGKVKPPLWMKNVLEAKDRRAAAETASPDGLYLIKVRYKEPYSFPLSQTNFLL